MAWNLITHAFATGNGSADCQTSAVNTSGADLIVIAVDDFASGFGVLSDSNGNTWTSAVSVTDGASVGRNTIYYNQAPTVGAGHTFKVSGTNNYCALYVLAFSGSANTPLDQINSNALTSGSPVNIQPGSVTPGQNGELLICSLLLGSSGSTGIAIDSSFSQADAASSGVTSTYYGEGLAYFAQDTAGALNPTWSWTTATTCAAAIATFKGSAALALLMGAQVT